jgi:hypothetical protein
MLGQDSPTWVAQKLDSRLWKGPTKEPQGRQGHNEIANCTTTYNEHTLHGWLQIHSGNTLYLKVH